MLTEHDAVNLDIVTSEVPDETAQLFLAVPWELLAQGDRFSLRMSTVPSALSAGSVRLRQIPVKPAYQDLAVMFMVAAPRDADDPLNHEAEEHGILTATANLPLSLTVEESGRAPYLRDRLAAEGPFEIVHLICHGNIADRDLPKLGLKTGDPYLALEDELGSFTPVIAVQLAEVFGEPKPGLLLLTSLNYSQHDSGIPRVHTT